MIKSFPAKHRTTKPSIRPTRLRQPALCFGLIVLSALLFGLAYVQWPLYTGKQHTKFLHGLTQSGHGFLASDWLVNTIDPLPAFTWLVYATHLTLGETFFFGYQALLLGLYLVSLYGIVVRLFPLARTLAGPLVFATTLVAIHSTLLPPFNASLFGTSLGWLLQSGVAGQYMFNPAFQPTSFGALLLLSICLFLYGRPLWASAAAALAALFHPAYMLSAALLVGWYVTSILWEKRDWVQALLTGALALAVVAPMLIYSYVVLGPTTPELWARAQEIIVNFRIPHHSLPELWIDDAVYARLALVIVATVLVRRTRLLPIMLLSLVAALGLTFVQWWTDSNSLAFLAPWRISAYLVPLSTALIVGVVVAWIFDRKALAKPVVQSIVALVAVALLGLLVVRGVQATSDGFRARQQEPTMPMMRFVAQRKALGETYLIPSALAEFRLEAGVPVVVTYKSHPYKDVEVIEWYDRLQAVDAFYAAPDCGKLAEMAAAYGVTHVVMPASEPPLECEPRLEQLYQDEVFGVWQVNF